MFALFFNLTILINAKSMHRFHTNETTDSEAYLCLFVDINENIFRYDNILSLVYQQ